MSQPATPLVGWRERRGRGCHCRRLLRWALAVTRFALVFAVAVWSAATVAIACGLGVQRWQAWFGLAIAFTAAVGPMAKDRRGAALAVGAVALLSLWAARRWPDCSWDGVLYHQPAVHALVDGWNPWFDDVAVLADRVPAGLADAVHLSAGGNHACAVRQGGTVVCWGSNSVGQLGDGSTTNASRGRARQGHPKAGPYGRHGRQCWDGSTARQHS